MQKNFYQHVGKRQYTRERYDKWVKVRKDIDAVKAMLLKYLFPMQGIPNGYMASSRSDMIEHWPFQDLMCHPLLKLSKTC